MLVTVAAQLASLVGDAHLLDSIAAATHEAPVTEHGLETVPSAGPSNGSAASALSPGIGVGQAYVVDGFDEWRRAWRRRATTRQRERTAAGAGDGRARDEIVHLSQRISELVGEDHGAILQAQLMIMQDRTIEHDLNACLEAGATRRGGAADHARQVRRRVSEADDAVLPGARLRHQGCVSSRSVAAAAAAGGGAGGERVVLVAREASVMELFAVDLDRLAAVVVEHGGPQSHAAILARSLGIPMVGQVAGLRGPAHPGRRLLVDGTTGDIVLDPADRPP